MNRNGKTNKWTTHSHVYNATIIRTHGRIFNVQDEEENESYSEGHNNRNDNKRREMEKTHQKLKINFWIICNKYVEKIEQNIWIPIKCITTKLNSNKLFSDGLHCIKYIDRFIGPFL